MCNETNKASMVSSVVRSLAIAAVFVPVTLGVTNGISRVTNPTEDTTSQRAQIKQIEADLTKDCYFWMMSKDDSKVEREAETAIDEYFGGSVGYQNVCDKVLN